MTLLPAKVNELLNELILYNNAKYALQQNDNTDFLTFARQVDYGYLVDALLVVTYLYDPQFRLLVDMIFNESFAPVAKSEIGPEFQGDFLAVRATPYGYISIYENPDIYQGYGQGLGWGLRGISEAGIVLQ